MSIFEDRSIPCPHCHHEAVRNVAAVLHGGKSPHLRQEICEGRFQQFLCLSCQGTYAVEGPLIYVDHDAGYYIGVYPRGWERSWRSLEEEPRTSWHHSTQHPGVDAITVRAVFGLGALREKLLCLDAGVDDRVLEVLKLDLMRSTGELPLHPRCRPTLWRLDERKLTFTLEAPHVSGWRSALLSVPRTRLSRIAQDASPWAAAIESISAGPYVDCGRLLIPGDAAA